MKPTFFLFFKYIFCIADNRGTRLQRGAQASTDTDELCFGHKMTMKKRITLKWVVNNKSGLSPNSTELREEEIRDLIRNALDGGESER